MGPLVPGPQTHLLLLSHLGPFLSCHHHSLVSGSCIFSWTSVCLCILKRSGEDCLLESERGLGAQPGFSPAVWSPEAARAGVGGMSSPDPAGKGGLCTQLVADRVASVDPTPDSFFSQRPLRTRLSCVSPLSPLPLGAHQRHSPSVLPQEPGIFNLGTAPRSPTPLSFGFI